MAKRSQNFARAIYIEWDVAIWRAMSGAPSAERTLSRKPIVGLAFSLLAALAITEWYHKFDVSLGILYTLPVVVAASVASRWQIFGFAIFAALVRGLFTPAASGLEHVLKFVMASIAYTSSGLLIVEISMNHRRLLAHYASIRLEQNLRRRAEEQLRLLAESSPAAILTLNADTVVEAANRAAHELLMFSPGALVGTSAESFFPVFAGALKLSPGERPIRTSLTGWAGRKDGQLIPVQAWFSVYGQGENKRLAAIVVDMSEEIRDRERENLKHILDNQRLLAGAVSHEIRNMCSAISVVCSNLNDRGDLRGNADFEALNSLVQSLSRLSSFQLQRRTVDAPLRTDLRMTLNQLRVVIESDWSESDRQIRWNLPENMPRVEAAEHELLQIFLNLAQNSWRAVASSPERLLTVSGEHADQDFHLHFFDTGPGIANQAALFQPFHPDAAGSGLGLFIAREVARSFGGDLLHVPVEYGCQFSVLIPVSPTIAAEMEANG